MAEAILDSNRTRATMLRMGWIDLFHDLAIPFVAGLAMTLLKLMADGKLVSWDDSNDIALDLVLIAAGALAVLYGRPEHLSPDAMYDAGVGDLFAAVILLLLRFQRRLKGQHGRLPAIGPVGGLLQLTIGSAAIIWTVKAF
ncbi:MAG: hypothetical protein WA294_01145 [Acidobacteriaceae bacterium]